MVMFQLSVPIFRAWLVVLAEAHSIRCTGRDDATFKIHHFCLTSFSAEAIEAGLTACNLLAVTDSLSLQTDC
jgi:hypothetical protein